MLSTQPYKGTRDFFPEDMRLRNYMFEVWKKVCLSYGYEEYDGPLLEDLEVYKAKTGEEIVNEQLYTFTDRGDREVAIRPEMTPTLARMVAEKYKVLPRPIRWFSVPNLYRYEKPQRGRLREHYQLNVDIFGVDGIEADFEIISVAIDIMKAFNAQENMYEIRVGNRRLIEDIYENFGIEKDQGIRVSKAIDRKSKVPNEVFEKLLKEDAKLDENQLKNVVAFLENPKNMVLEMSSKQSKGAKEVQNLLNLTDQNDFSKIVKYDPTIMRGFDYYTGNVFEQFDMNPENNRSMYGGGRYDDLVEMFNGNKLTGVGLGMGDVTMQNFLQDWNLLPNFETPTEYLVALWPAENTEKKEESNKYLKETLKTAAELRKKGYNVETWLEADTNLTKQLKYANKKGIKNVVIIGEEELKNGQITIKNMDSGYQDTINATSM